MKHRNILITNDDGIGSEGIRLLAETAARLGDVWVVAPAEQCSAMSQRITIFDDLIIRKQAFDAPVRAAWSVAGTPADCVKAALGRLLPVRPDVLLSGINNGFNAGFDVAYSGTIGAAMEGRMNGVIALAFSNAYQGSLAVAERELLPLLRRLLAEPIGDGAIWNVNFPGCAMEDYRGVLWGRTLAPTQLYLDQFSFFEEPDGALRMRNRGVPISKVLVTEGTDVHAVLSGFISVGQVRCMVIK